MRAASGPVLWQHLPTLSPPPRLTKATAEQDSVAPAARDSAAPAARDSAAPAVPDSAAPAALDSAAPAAREVAAAAAAHLRGRQLQAAGLAAAAAAAVVGAVQLLPRVRRAFPAALTLPRR